MSVTQQERDQAAAPPEPRTALQELKTQLSGALILIAFWGACWVVVGAVGWVIWSFMTGAL